jgi:hypothetical protein
MPEPSAPERFKKKLEDVRSIREELGQLVVELVKQKQQAITDTAREKLTAALRKRGVSLRDDLIFDLILSALDIHVFGPEGYRDMQDILRVDLSDPIFKEVRQIVHKIKDVLAKEKAPAAAK